MIVIDRSWVGRTGGHWFYWFMAAFGLACIAFTGFMMLRLSKRAFRWLGGVLVGAGLGLTFFSAATLNGSVDYFRMWSAFESGDVVGQVQRAEAYLEAAAESGMTAQKDNMLPRVTWRGIVLDRRAEAAYVIADALYLAGDDEAARETLVLGARIADQQGDSELAELLRSKTAE
jgi:hypothetical protein